MQSKLQRRVENNVAELLAQLSAAQIHRLSVPEIAEHVQLLHAAGLSYARRAVEAARAIGQLLVEAKRRGVEHGKWRAFVEHDCRIGLRSAQNYMRLVRLQPERTLDHLGVVGLLELHAQHKGALRVETTSTPGRSSVVVAAIRSEPAPPLQQRTFAVIEAPRLALAQPVDRLSEAQHLLAALEPDELAATIAFMRRLVARRAA